MNKLIDKVLQQVGQVVLGKDPQVMLAISCLLAKGHLLIEDLPGMGKTTLAQCLAKIMGLEYSRVQFTSDLLPGDILGVAIYDQTTGKFRFRKGPVFTQLLLADEVNRSTPKTQSALLEAMEEQQVTIEGKTRPLPEPFFVIATQNPMNQSGTYPLPESQLDRFLMRISLGYPSEMSERALFKGLDSRANLRDVPTLIDPPTMRKLQASVREVKTSDQIIDYLQRLVAYTRYDQSFTYGLSPRGALGLLASAKAWAFICGREHVIPEDIQRVVPAVVGHRVRGKELSNHVNHENNSEITQHLIKSVDVLS